MEARNLKKMDVRGSSGILLYLGCVIIKLFIDSRKAILYLEHFYFLQMNY